VTNSAPRLAVDCRAGSGTDSGASCRPCMSDRTCTVRSARIFRFPYWAMAGLAAAACLTLTPDLREIPVAEKVQPVKRRTSPSRGPWRRKSWRVARWPPPSSGRFRSRSSFPGKIRGWRSARRGCAADGGGRTRRCRGAQSCLPRPNPSPDASLGSGGAMKEAWASAAAPAPASPGRGGGHQTLAVRRDSRRQPGRRLSGTTHLAGSRAQTQFKRPRLRRARFGVRALWMRPGRPTAVRPGARAFNTEAYDYIEDNGFVAVVQKPALDYFRSMSTPRAIPTCGVFLLGGRRPAARRGADRGTASNYFTYGYPAPAAADPAPFAATLEAASAPWAPSHPAGSHRPEEPRALHGGAPGRQPGVPRRRVGFV